MDTQMITHTNTKTHEYLVGRFGPLLQLEEVADLLRRSPRAIATALTSRGRQDPWLVQLRGAVRRIGRRRLFSAEGVAALIDGEEVAQ